MKAQATVTAVLVAIMLTVAGWGGLGGSDGSGGSGGGPGLAAESVVYVADQDSNDQDECYLSSNSAVTPLKSAVVSGGDVRPFPVTPDGTRVVHFVETFV
jgi:hypothetical protein